MSDKASKVSKRSRREGRTIAVQTLYAFEQKRYADDGELVVPDELIGEEPSCEFGRDLFVGFVTERAAVDAVVDGSLKNWTLTRLALPDRCILRLGCYELLYCANTPPRVVINEYIELAKQFGSEGKSAKLVNGVLDKIAREHRGEEVTGRHAKSEQAKPEQAKPEQTETA